MFSSLGKRSSSTEEPTSTAGWLGMGIVYTTLTANNIFKKETVLSLKSYKYTAKKYVLQIKIWFVPAARCGFGIGRDGAAT